MAERTILIADDDEAIAELIALYVAKEGYTPIIATDGREALTTLEQQRIDLAILDVMMPYRDGLAVCEEIKQLYDIPVLLVTARAEVDDRIRGFQFGTDDYVTKPFHPVELIMRVKALMRRYQVSDELTVHDVRLQQGELTVSIAHETWTLPKKQFELLYVLLANEGKVVLRDTLITKVWGLDYDGDERTLDNHIKKLRKQFSAVEHLLKIETVRGLGYKVEVAK